MNRFTAILATGISLLAFASAAHAADLIIEQPAAAPMVEAASGSWDGFYIGAFGGYALGEAYDDNGDSIVDLDGQFTYEQRTSESDVAGVSRVKDFVRHEYSLGLTYKIN